MTRRFLSGLIFLKALFSFHIPIVCSEESLEKSVTVKTTSPLMLQKHNQIRSSLESIPSTRTSNKSATKTNHDASPRSLAVAAKFKRGDEFESKSVAQEFAKNIASMSAEVIGVIITQQSRILFEKVVDNVDDLKGNAEFVEFLRSGIHSALKISAVDGKDVFSDSVRDINIKDIKKNSNAEKTYDVQYDILAETETEFKNIHEVFDTIKISTFLSSLIFDTNFELNSSGTLKDQFKLKTASVILVTENNPSAITGTSPKTTTYFAGLTTKPIAEETAADDGEDLTLYLIILGGIVVVALFGVYSNITNNQGWCSINL